MTKKEMYAEMREMMVAAGRDELVEFCEKEINALERRTEKARETAQKKREEADPIVEMVANVLTEDWQTIADIADQIEDENASVSKITYRLNKLAETGIAEKAKVEIPATDEVKKRRVTAYRLVSTENNCED